jgi:hypothetical protein
MFEWNEGLGVRPVEGQNGSFNGRETRVETCSCGAGNSYYLDNGELCEEQSEALHAEFHGYESVTAFNEAMEQSASNVAGDIFDAVIAPMLFEAMLARALGIPQGYSLQIIPISAEEAAAMGFPVSTDESPAGSENRDDDWMNATFGDGQLPPLE